MQTADEVFKLIVARAAAAYPGLPQGEQINRLWQSRDPEGQDLIGQYMAALGARPPDAVIDRRGGSSTALVSVTPSDANAGRPAATDASVTTGRLTTEQQHALSDKPLTGPTTGLLDWRTAVKLAGDPRASAVNVGATRISKATIGKDLAFVEETLDRLVRPLVELLAADPGMNPDGAVLKAYERTPGLFTLRRKMVNDALTGRGAHAVVASGGRTIGFGIGALPKVEKMIGVLVAEVKAVKKSAGGGMTNAQALDSVLSLGPPDALVRKAEAEAEQRELTERRIRKYGPPCETCGEYHGEAGEHDEGEGDESTHADDPVVTCRACSQDFVPTKKRCPNCDAKVSRKVRKAAKALAKHARRA